MSSADPKLPTLSLSPDLMKRRLGVAVSGGSDSLALLKILKDAGHTDLMCVTVNHGLRKEAAKEALHVAAICEAENVSHKTLTWDRWRGDGNLQDQARRARYSLLADWGRRTECAAIALGHTREDVAETFLMRLARASGVDGLSAMAPRFERDGMTFVRPLLDMSRADLRAFLCSRDIQWIDDPTNVDQTYDRSRMRQALPELAKLGLSVENLSASATYLREASDALSRIAREWCDEHVDVPAGDIVVSRRELFLQPLELRRRILSRALQWVGSAEYPPRALALTRVLEAVADANEADRMTLLGCKISFDEVSVRITRELAAVAQVATMTDEPWDHRWHFIGPHSRDLRVRVLDKGLSLCPDWRISGLPRSTLLASPAIWQGDKLISAPLAGLSGGWTLVVPNKEQFLNAFVPH